MRWLGLDIGGANVKLADGSGYAESQPFALWQRPDDLGQTLRTLIAQAPPYDQMAVTMTGELADCFQNKTEGVQRILDAVEHAVEGRPTRVYLTRGVLAPVSAARECAAEVAAANWHAVARFSGRFAPTGSAILIDVGSTTCDLIPLSDGRPCATGMNDTERLLKGELIYSGVTRTPICGLVSHMLWRGAPCPIALEWFATTRDVYILTNDLPEDASDTNTADGQTATKDAAQTRLARLICADTLSRAEAVISAQAIAATHTNQIADGIRQIVDQMAQPPGTVIVSGDGEFLARRALDVVQLGANVVSLKDQLGENISRCAPAHAVAVLAREDETA